MSLERRIADALHSTNDYQPSLDLFSRVHRSIEEDASHRRRIRLSIILVASGLAALAVFFRSVATTSGGELLLPKYSLEVARLTVLAVLLLGLGPVIRRFGRPLLNEVFRMSPNTGVHFSRLLDIAYYLFFGGSIISGVDPTEPGRLLTLADELIRERLASIAGFMVQLGVVHVANLALLPFIALLFASTIRRAKRRAARGDAPPRSEAARKADRIAAGIVYTITGVAVAGLLILIGFALLATGIP